MKDEEVQAVIRSYGLRPTSTPNIYVSPDHDFHCIRYSPNLTDIERKDLVREIHATMGVTDGHLTS